jgi:general secretion pathway protein J
MDRTTRTIGRPDDFARASEAAALKSSTRGFTLLELLIGLALLGLILTLLYGGFRLATRIWDGVEKKAEQSADAQAGQSLIRRVMGQAQPIHWKGLKEQPLAFSGEQNMLRVIAPLGTTGLRVVELGIEADDQRGDRSYLRIVLRHGPVLYNAGQFAQGLDDREPKQLLNGLTEAEFSYFGGEVAATEPHWQDHWTRTDQFPKLVRLHLTFQGAESLDIDVAPMVSGSTGPTGVRLTAGPV